MCLSLVAQTAFAQADIPTANLESGQSTYRQALALLEAGDWEAATVTLEDLVVREPSAAVYYQLAFAAAQRDDVPLAMWAVYSSEALGGVSETAALRRQIEATVPAPQRALSTSTLERLVHTAERLLGDSVLVGIALLSAWLGVGFLLWGGRRARGVGITMLLLAAVSTFVAFRQNQLAQPGQAVVLRSTEVYVAPSASSEAVAELSPGAWVQVGETLTGFTQVELPTGATGWIAVEDLRLIDPLGLSRQAN